MSLSIPLSILDLAPIRPGQSATDSFAASVALAQAAEEWGYRRVWYAEHHNIPTIASSATDAGPEARCAGRCASGARSAPLCRSANGSAAGRGTLHARDIRF